MAKPWQSDQAIIVVNLGSPEAPTEKAVRRYLREFLMDRHVLNLPFLLRWLLVNLVIAPFRAKRSAQAYRKIWTDEGSPLIAITERFVAELAKHTDAPVYAAMRYGSPERKIPTVMEQVRRAGFKRVFVVPLYPHYAQATTGTVFAQASRIARKLGLELKFLPRFYWYSAYLDLLAEKIKEVASTHDFVLFSYHGLPESHIRKTDKFGYCLRSADCCRKIHLTHFTCYRHQVIATTESVATRAGLKPGQYTYAFQSRLGRGRWLEPATQELVPQLVRRGIKRLSVIAPAFVADNLETLEELDIAVRDLFLRAGGEKFTYIPCLNDEPRWVQAFAQLIA